MNYQEDLSYHEKTKHSYFSIRNHPNHLDWNNQPAVFKSYPNSFEETPLNLEYESHAFLYYIASINAKKSYPGVEYYLRINPSAGALYPNEIYFQSRNNEHIQNGIYHLNIAHNSISLLYPLNENEGLEPFLNLSTQMDGFILLTTALYYRSAWKYKNRAFRYCLLDSGHVLGCIENSAYMYNKTYTLVYDFDKTRLNAHFGFTQKEFFLTACVVGNATIHPVVPIQFELPYVEGTEVFEANILIEEAYTKSLDLIEPKANNEHPHFNYVHSVLQECVLKRRSIREFKKQAISKEQFEAILSVLEQPIPSDCDEPVDIYCVINRVKGMPLGLYKNQHCLKEGDFISKAGYLCLEQELGSSSSVTFFLTSKGKNYQALYQKAGIIGHRLYTVCTYMNIGCSGIGAYYDDEVCEFIEEHTLVLYALAMGN
jgi:SagB-type dehydrogenase family enzyme